MNDPLPAPGDGPAISRRAALKLGLVGVLGAAVGAGSTAVIARLGRAARPRYRFFTDAEANLLIDICEQIIPRDDVPGATDTGAINYIDRQTLSVLAPILKDHYHWTNTDFATVLIAFRVVYTIMQSVSGRLLDRLGTRRGLSISVAFYSTVAACTAFAQGLGGFRIFRGLLGAGESAGWPGAAKAEF